MKLISVLSYFRPPFAPSSIEDASFINSRANLYGVADGVSAAYSPSHPPLYYGTLTGGQMAVQELCSSAVRLEPDVNLRSLLLKVNEAIFIRHNQAGKNPKNDNVAGASFAICQINSTSITFIVAGDCFALFRIKENLRFLTGFDQPAHRLKERADRLFAKCLRRAGNNKGRAWDLFQPLYQAGKIKYTNKRIGRGGYAELNGDPALEDCWTVIDISASCLPRYILLGTDGLIPSQSSSSGRQNEIALQLENHYLKGGIPGLLGFRDGAEKGLCHLNGWPEASAVELKFS
ncbi:MAG: hypothetical protein PHS62_05395 [Patescibacteria group bacterium]|nr:hypothetical protein [Patescibacteria group bacterium]